jgi:CheY-like chemotaxis protein
MVEVLLPTLYVALAEVGKGAASDFGKRLVDGFGRIYSKHFGDTVPEPATLTSADLRTVLAESAEVRDLATDYLAHSTALRRARVAAKSIEGARILWVDDKPAWNRLECRALEGLGAHIVTVESTYSALSCLAAEDYDLLISDIARTEGPLEGLEALPRFSRVAPDTRVVLYVGHVDAACPPGAFGITADPDELLHLCMDVFERIRL